MISIPKIITAISFIFLIIIPVWAKKETALLGSKVLGIFDKPTEINDIFAGKSTLETSSTHDSEYSSDENDDGTIFDLIQFLKEEQATSYHPRFKSVYKLPGKYKNLPIYHLEANRQTDSTSCGFHSIINAWAIQELLKENTPISSESVKKKALEKVDHIEEEALLCEDDIIKKAQDLGVENVFIAERNIDVMHYQPIQNNTRGWHNWWLKWEPFKSVENKNDSISYTHAVKENDIYETYLYDEEQMQQKINCFMHKTDPWAIHFISYTSCHWVLFSVVKDQGKKPVIFYMNSTNVPIMNNSPEDIILQKLISMTVDQPSSLKWYSKSALGITFAASISFLLHFFTHSYRINKHFCL